MADTIFNSFPADKWVDQPLLLTIPEAAKAMNISRSTVQELVLRGDLKSLKIGHSRRIPISAIYEFIQGKTVGAPKGSTANNELDDSTDS